MPFVSLCTVPLNHGGNAQSLLPCCVQIIPLLTELRAGNLVGNVEALTQVAAEAAADIQRLQMEVLTENNVQALRESVQTLAKTLQHIERITGAWGWDTMLEGA